MNSVKTYAVVFYSPGIFVPEQRERVIDSRDIDKAVELAKEIKRACNVLPYGFEFTTRASGRVIREGRMHYLVEMTDL